MKLEARNIPPRSRSKSRHVQRPNQETGVDALVLDRWSSFHSYVLLAALTLLCLLPFSGKAFDADDTLFVWAAQRIVKHPLDPYGFRVVWYTTEMSMWEVTKNPPLGCYYSALIGSVAGWSERTLHLAFLLPALTVILGSYHLAQRFTRAPLVAAAAALLTPGFLVSSTNLMCDTTMLAIWNPQPLTTQPCRPLNEILIFLYVKPRSFQRVRISYPPFADQVHDGRSRPCLSGCVPR